MDIEQVPWVKKIDHRFMVSIEMGLHYIFHIQKSISLIICARVVYRIDYEVNGLFREITGSGYAEFNMLQRCDRNRRVNNDKTIDNEKE